MRFRIILCLGIIRLGEQSKDQTWIIPPREILEAHVREGVIILKRGDFILTGDRWILVFDLPFQPFLDTASTLLAELEKFVRWISDVVLPHDISNPDAPTKKEEGRNFPDPVIHCLREEAIRLQYQVRQIQFRFRELQHTSSIPILELQNLRYTPRRPRGLIDAGGKVLKWLFGTVTNEDLEKLSEKVDRVAGSSKELIHLAEDQASLINVTVENQKRNQRSIGLLTEITSNLTVETYRLKEQLENTSWSLWRTMTSIHMIQISARRISIAAMELDNEAVRLTQALEVTAKNRLSPYIISPEQLFKILQNVSLELPAEMSLAVPLRPDSTYVYYHWSDVQAAATGNMIRLFINIPLKSLERNFELFQLLPMPSYVKGTKYSIIAKPTTEYISVNYDRQAFLEMSRRDLESCIIGPINVCEPQTAIRTHPSSSCAYELFLGLKDTPECEKEVLYHPEPYFFRVSNEGVWAYSVVKPIILTIKCPRPGKKKVTYEVTSLSLNSSGMITIPATCSAHATGLTLPSSYVGHSKEMQFFHHDIQVPDIDTLMNASSIKLIKRIAHDEAFKQIRQKLESLKQVSLIPVGISLKEIEREIQGLERQERTSMAWFEPRTIPAPTITTLAILGLMGGLVWLNCCPCAKHLVFQRRSDKGIFSGPRFQILKLAQRRHPAPPVQESRTIEGVQDMEPLHEYGSLA